MQYETAIIGGGVLGLWAARHAIRRGEKVILIEKRKIGAGASGGFLGALMPHMPDGWDAKKQFQYEGLISLESVVRELEEETGIDCGYKMCGRLMPLAHEKMLTHMPIRTTGSDKYWDEGLEMYHTHALDQPYYANGWMSRDLAKFGVQEDTFSARINPRAYMAALEASVRPKAQVLEGVAMVSFSPRTNGYAKAVLDNGEVIEAHNLVIANGYEAYPMLQSSMGSYNHDKPIGRGVKGQAILVEYEHDDDLPIVYNDGVFVVPHANNKVAIGSTSRKDWQTSSCPQPDAFDGDDLEFYHKAVAMVPAIKDAPVVERWAAVRPRNTLDGKGTDPYFADVPNCEGVRALIGGFKITLGIAHVAEG